MDRDMKDEFVVNETEYNKLFVNYYFCDKCQEGWIDYWSCACDDRCPSCETSIEPYQSEDVTNENL